jgi:hypothetical protein
MSSTDSNMFLEVQKASEGIREIGYEKHKAQSVVATTRAKENHGNQKSIRRTLRPNGMSRCNCKGEADK